MFGAASLGAPPLAYLLVRTVWIGFRGRAFDPALSWPVWLLAAVAVFLGGLRIGLNVENPHGVIDVGYAGVIGGDRILDGEAPVRPHAGRGHGRVLRRRRRARARSATGSRRTAAASPPTRAATPTGRSRTSSTSRPSSSSVWNGKWDSLPAAHATAIAFDLLVVLGLFLVGLALRRAAGSASRSPSAGWRFPSPPTR